MSDRKIDIDLSTSTEPRVVTEVTRAEHKARLAQVLERGIVNDRLYVPLPPDVHGEWISNNKEEIYRMEAMGFEIDKTYAKKRALHNDGTDKSIVGDVVFMTCSKLNKELIDEVRWEKFEAMHAQKAGKQKEERDFEKATKRDLEGSHMATVASSEQHSVTKDEIKAAIDT